MGKRCRLAARQDDDFVYYEGIVAGDYRLRVEYDGALQPVPQEAFSYACSQPVVPGFADARRLEGKVR